MTTNDAACAAMVDDACTQLAALQVQLEQLPPGTDGRLWVQDKIEILNARIEMLETGYVPASMALPFAAEDHRHAA